LLTDQYKIDIIYGKLVLILFNWINCILADDISAITHVHDY